MALRTDRTRLGLMAGAAVAIVVTIALLTPRVGAIGAGTMLALVIAVVATRQALHSHRREEL